MWWGLAKAEAVRVHEFEAWMTKMVVAGAAVTETAVVRSRTRA